MSKSDSYITVEEEDINSKSSIIEITINEILGQPLFYPLIRHQNNSSKYKTLFKTSSKKYFESMGKSNY